MSAGAFEAEQLLDVVGRIYDTVFDAALWPEALRGVCESIDGLAASLISHTLPDQHAHRLAEYGTDPAFSERYSLTYSRMNPLFGMTILDMAEGETRTLHRSIDLTAFRRTPFYREWVAPQDWDDWLASLLDRSSHRVSLLAVARKAGRGSFSERDLATMRALTPHLQRAARIGRLIGSTVERNTGLTYLLERMAAAALLIDSRGRIDFANAAAKTMLNNPARARWEAGDRLRLADPAAERLLQSALRGEALRPQSVVAREGRERYVLYVLPASAETAGRVAVLAAAPQDALTPPGPVLRQGFGLTEAEFRVLSRLVAGRSTEEIAKDLGITLRTVRAHLQKLFEKLGVERQSELVRTVLSLTAPLRDVAEK